MPEGQPTRRDIAIKVKKTHSKKYLRTVRLQAAVEAAIIVFLMVLLFCAPELLFGPNQKNDSNTTMSTTASPIDYYTPITVLPTNHYAPATVSLTDVPITVFATDHYNSIRNQETIGIVLKESSVLPIVFSLKLLSLSLKVLNNLLIACKNSAYITGVHFTLIVSLLSYIVTLIPGITMILNHWTDNALAVWVFLAFCDITFFIAMLICHFFIFIPLADAVHFLKATTITVEAFNDI